RTAMSSAGAFTGRCHRGDQPGRSKAKAKSSRGAIETKRQARRTSLPQRMTHATSTAASSNTLPEPCEDVEEVEPPSDASGASGVCTGNGALGTGAPGALGAGAAGAADACTAFGAAFLACWAQRSTTSRTGLGVAFGSSNAATGAAGSVVVASGAGVVAGAVTVAGAGESPPADGCLPDESVDGSAGSDGGGEGSVGGVTATG